MRQVFFCGMLAYNRNTYFSGMSVGEWGAMFWQWRPSLLSDFRSSVCVFGQRPSGCEICSYLLSKACAGLSQWWGFGCSGIFWCFISFPRISPHFRREKKNAGFLLQISSGLCECFPPRTAQKFLVWERPKSCTIRTFNIFLANDIRSIVFEGLFCLDREIRQRPLGWLLYFGQRSCWHVGPIKQWYKWNSSLLREKLNINSVPQDVLRSLW